MSSRRGPTSYEQSPEACSLQTDQYPVQKILTSYEQRPEACSLQTDHYRVQKILDRNDKTELYRVRWHKHGENEDSWLPPGDLRGCQRLVRAFWRRRHRKGAYKAGKAAHAGQGYNPDCACGGKGPKTWAAVVPGQVLQCGQESGWLAGWLARCLAG